MNVLERVPTDRRGQVGALTGAAILWWLLYSLNLPFWDWLLYDVFGMDPDARLTETLHFFFYDTVKIALLLTGIIFVVTVLRSFMSVERTRALLGGRREGIGNVMAAGLGVITPFCSCSAVPAFIGFVAAGVPIGVTLSFLIASPLANEIAIGLLWSLFGWEIALLYVVAAVTIAIVAGWILGRLHVERWVEPFVFETTLRGQAIDPAAGLTFDQRIVMGVEEVATILRKIWPYLLVGIGLGALIHGWVPTEFFTTYASSDNPFGVAGRRGDRGPALLERRRHHAAGRGAVLQGHADGHRAGVHDERGGPVPAGDDPAAPGPAAEAARPLHRRCRHRDRRRRLPLQRHPRLGRVHMTPRTLGSPPPTDTDHHRRERP